MNSEIKRLIDLATEKGTITDRQKQIIIQKAELLGDDIDEVEIVLENIPILNNNYNGDGTQSSVKSTTHYGEIKRCPHCGAVVSDYIGKCLECGYVFRNVQLSLSYSALRENILRYEKELHDTGDTSVYQKIATFIRTVPVPSSKADIIELMSICSGNIMDPNNGDDYRAKAEECIMKGEALFGDDKQITQSIITARKCIKRQQIKTNFYGEVFSAQIREEQKAEKSQNLKYLMILIVAVMLIMCS